MNTANGKRPTIAQELRFALRLIEKGYGIRITEFRATWGSLKGRKGASKELAYFVEKIEFKSDV